MNNRESANKIKEQIIFETTEDLFNISKTQVLLFKGGSKSLSLDADNRLFQSYCYEFCGLTGLSLKTLRFQNLNRDIRPDTVISTGCTVQLTHKIEFTLESYNSLQSSLADLFHSGILSDVLVRCATREITQKELPVSSDFSDESLTDEFRENRHSLQKEDGQEQVISVLDQTSQHGSLKNEFTMNYVEDIPRLSLSALQLLELPQTDKVYRLHKPLLIARSKIFQRIFEYDGFEKCEELLGQEFDSRSLLQTKNDVPDELEEPVFYWIRVERVEDRRITEISLIVPRLSECGLVDQLLEFLYTSHIRFSGKVLRTFSLMLLADKMMMFDLKQRCEDDLLNKLEDDNFFEVFLLLFESRVVAVNLDLKLKNLFFKNFQKIKANVENFEEVIYKRKGLMSSLFEHISGKKKINRRVTFVEIDD